MQAVSHPVESLASSSSEPNLGKAKPRNRLTREGTALLEAYLRDHPDEDFPDLTVRKELLDRLHALPGLENYSAVNLSGWLRRHCREKPSPLPSTLHHEAIKQLAILNRGQPNPPLDVIQVWSQLLHVSPEEIITHLQSQAFEDSQNQSLPPNHLPTPVSTSPEPQNDNMTYKSDPTHSPKVPVASVHQQQMVPQYEHPLSRKSILKALSQAASNTEPIKKSATLIEFNEMFAQYSQMMEDFLQRNEEYLRYHSSLS